MITDSFVSKMGTPTLKLRKIGNSTGVILSRQMLAKLGVAEGDELFAVQTPEGLRLTPFDPHFVEVVESGRRYMRRYRNAMRELAKR